MSDHDTRPGGPAQGNAKVPIMDDIVPLYTSVLGQPGLLVRLTGLMLVILVVLDLVIALHLQRYTPAELQALFERGSIEIFGPILLQLVVTLYVTTKYAVRWHRYSLLGQDEYNFADIAPRPRDWRYFGYGLLVGLSLGVVLSLALTLFSGVAAAGGGTSSLLVIVLVVATFYTIARLSLVFPGAAVDAAVTLGDSWRRTRGNGWRIMLLMAVTTLPVGLLAELAPGIVPLSLAGLPLFSALLQSIVVNFFLLITVALGQNALSHAYRHLIGPPAQRRLGQV